MPNNQNVKADKVLEINVNHDVFQSLKDAYEKDKEKLTSVYEPVVQSSALDRRIADSGSSRIYKRYLQNHGLTCLCHISAR